MISMYISSGTTAHRGPLVFQCLCSVFGVIASLDSCGKVPFMSVSAQTGLHSPLLSAVVVDVHHPAAAFDVDGSSPL